MVDLLLTRHRPPSIYFVGEEVAPSVAKASKPAAATVAAVTTTTQADAQIQKKKESRFRHDWYQSQQVSLFILLRGEGEDGRTEGEEAGQGRMHSFLRFFFPQLLPMSLLQVVTVEVFIKGSNPENCKVVFEKNSVELERKLEGSDSWQMQLDLFAEIVPGECAVNFSGAKVGVPLHLCTS